MSVCPPQIFRRCARPDGRVGRGIRSVEIVRRNANTVGEPLAPYDGAAAFLIARSRSFTRHALSAKEPIEDQANRHL
ncbi:MAG: hypothetical protein PPHERAN_5477 [uncultured Paraburkholderia sp.]|nr:MAG: hypothetical protein PPHERAN_5477 [uncultured Paraburkholderia sp.]